MFKTNKMNPLLKKAIFILALSMGLTNFIMGQKLPDMQMKGSYENTLEYEWSQKAVLESQQLSGMESMEGWNVAPGYIAYNHVGYAAGFPKTALASDLSARRFSLVDVTSNETVLQKSIAEKETPLGTFQVLDFSEFEQPGTYVLKAGDEVSQEQIKNGVRLNDRYYLKRFPTWTMFRGNSGATLSQVKGLATIARYLEDRDLLVLSYKALDWHLGMNPFNQSLMYGEGYRYAAQYSAMSGNLVGGLPVGVQTHFNRDEPYWPAENCYNWKEIWIFPSGRWLWIMSDFSLMINNSKP